MTTPDEDAGFDIEFDWPRPPLISEPPPTDDIVLSFPYVPMCHCITTELEES